MKLYVLSILVFTSIGIDVSLADLTGNPFRHNKFYSVPLFHEQVIRTFQQVTSKTEKQSLKRIHGASAAFWCSTRAHISTSNPSNKNTLLGVLKDASLHRLAKQRVVTIVIYNIPNRDCSATASAGENCCTRDCNYSSSSDCSSGLLNYKRKFIDIIFRTLSSFCGKVPVAIILEPDSLANLVTNSGNPRCGSKSTKNAYLKGIQYAVKKLHRSCSTTKVYLDAGNGAWLGWESNARAYASVIARMNISSQLRGFAINIANYQPLGIRCPKVGLCNGGASKHPCCRSDVCGLTKEYNSGFTELNYVDTLALYVKKAIPGYYPRFVIDTSRNGVPLSRTNCANWCNIKKAGLGLMPTSKTNHELVDAFLWIKPPTESDGCTQQLPNNRGSCPSFDLTCQSKDSMGGASSDPRAPEAGHFFKSYFIQLVINGVKNGNN